MSAVGPGDSTVTFMRKKIRRLTASSSVSILPDALLDEYLNNALLNDFPYAIKLDQMRSVYTFYTEPYRDRYPLDVNFNQGVRSPLYVDGIPGGFFKLRDQFYNIWPRWPTQFQQGASTVTGEVSNVTLVGTDPVVISDANHGLITGNAITFNSDFVGTIELNGTDWVVTKIDDNNFSLDGSDSSLFTPYVSGGSWFAVTNRTFIFTLPGPFLSKEVTIGGVDSSGFPITINDDGNGLLQFMTTNPVVSVPAQTLNPAVPGMYNKNTRNPGLINPVNIGSVNYVTGVFNFTLPENNTLADGTLLTVRVAQYQPGKPYALLFWNNEFTIRPVPKKIHKVEIETYLTPVQFYDSTDLPILTQWAQYLSYIAAMEILRDRNDFEGVEGLREGFKRQEELVLECQGVEEIFQPTIQLFNSTQGYSVYGGYPGGYGGY